MIWLLLIPPLLVVAVWVDLFVWTRASRVTLPGGSIWHVRMGSWWPLLFGSDGFTVGNCSHFRPGHHPTGTLCAHEWFHTGQSIGPLDMIHYATSSTYRLAIETPAKAFGAAHGNDADWLATATTLGGMA